MERTKCKEILSMKEKRVVSRGRAFWERDARLGGDGVVVVGGYIIMYKRSTKGVLGKFM